MTFQISIDSEYNSESKVLSNEFNCNIEVSNVYTVNENLNSDERNKIANALHNPVVDTIRINQTRKGSFQWVLEIGFLPGVTDNIGNTASEIIKDLINKEVEVFSSKTLFISGRDDINNISKELVNTLIQRYEIKTYDKYLEDQGMTLVIPKVKLNSEPKVLSIDLKNEDLIELGKKGVYDPDKKVRRGTLALDEDYMNAIVNYFDSIGRNPSDIEIESIAQTWSEHCKHTIFAAQIDDIEEGLYKKYIKGATKKIREELKENDFCVSVFSDNAGGIKFDENYVICDKVETHNSPSALDPFGGAITGIVGVNRDVIGFGKGALPIANRYGFCVAKPEDNFILYRTKDKQNVILSPKRIFKGIIHGVNVGGNCSGIPTPIGFVNFDESYKGKPLVFVGTIGLLKGKNNHLKKALPSDNIVVVGGRVGKDGIHGATFSSEALDEKSPATAVQIGDPITQKKLSDAIIKEAHGMYNSITDNGAGGLSCSVAEMARESRGFIVNLEKVKLKYPGLEPWEIWISESQERMTLAIPDQKLDEFLNLMERRGVESSVIGKFNDTNKAIINFKGEEIFNLDMEFLHNGLPKRKLVTEPYEYIDYEDEINIKDYEDILKKVLASHNICSNEFISKQYDHEVQSNSILKPIIGKGRVVSNTSVIKPLFESNKGVVLSHYLNPRLSEINCYDMAASAIDTAIRNCVAVGGNVNHMALLDNFCWCSSTDSKKLFQLKETVKACYDYAVEFKTPFISGKDSMFNDFKGYDENNKEVQISVNPTLLISTIGVIDDVRKVKSFNFNKDELIYIIGKTKNELGGSELLYCLDKKSYTSPKVDAINARKLYEKIYEIFNLLQSCSSIERGGMIIALAKSSISGNIGIDINLNLIENLETYQKLFSESQSRFIVTIDKKNKEKFEKEMNNFETLFLGTVEGKRFIVNDDKKIIDLSVEELDELYKKRFKKW